ncbi:hypothetical protein EH240_26970 [Mesorhizobium tamadayense]|uniref:Uncharacterized protein n=1 Tax=Mesorhizobium tamadayense TaxID=425306 RepID=A0A3P3F7L6_9HYPH|nr:hypothetical protein EH240_26970 [Mesorhizobium tamadayense]
MTCYTKAGRGCLACFAAIEEVLVLVQGAMSAEGVIAA